MLSCLYIFSIDWLGGFLKVFSHSIQFKIRRWSAWTLVFLLMLLCIPLIAREVMQGLILVPGWYEKSLWFSVPIGGLFAFLITRVIYSELSSDSFVSEPARFLRVFSLPFLWFVIAACGPFAFGFFTALASSQEFKREAIIISVDVRSDYARGFPKCINPIKIEGELYGFNQLCRTEVSKVRSLAQGTQVELFGRGNRYFHLVESFE